MPDRQVRGVALGGGLLQIVLMCLVCGVLADFTGAPAKARLPTPLALHTASLIAFYRPFNHPRCCDMCPDFCSQLWKS